MTIWKPKPYIRAKVLGLVWRNDQLLAGEVEGSNGRVKGVRPLGGCIEFGETREAAILREFQEELGCRATLSGEWHTFENIFEHERNVGHEFVFAANVTLGDPKIYEGERVNYLEDDGLPCIARWFSPTALPAGLELYPSGLLDLIKSGSVSPVP